MIRQLIQYLEDLDRKVKDHIMARNIEKDEKIAQLS